MSDDESKGHHEAGDYARFAPGGYELAALAAGGAIEAMEAVMRGDVHNAYALVRPPGGMWPRPAGGRPGTGGPGTGGPGNGGGQGSEKRVCVCQG